MLMQRHLNMLKYINPWICLEFLKNPWDLVHPLRKRDVSEILRNLIELEKTDLRKI